MAADRPRDGAENTVDRAQLRRTVLAVVLAWLVPGLGHVWLGRVRRGLFFGAIIWGAFGLGLAHDGRLALKDQRQPFLTTLQVVANLGVGPADSIARLFVYGEPAYRLQRSDAAAEDAELGEIFRDRARSGLSIYGTSYLWTAGLMNLLAVLDVSDIARGDKD